MCLGTHDKEFCIVIDVMRPKGGKLKVEDRADDNGNADVNEVDVDNVSDATTTSINVNTTDDNSNDNEKENEQEKSVQLNAKENENDSINRNVSRFFRGVVRNTFLDFNEEDRGRTLLRSPRQPRASTWHPCKCSRYSRAADHESGQCQESGCQFLKNTQDSASDTTAASTVLDALPCKKSGYRHSIETQYTAIDKPIASTMPVDTGDCQKSESQQTENADSRFQPAVSIVLLETKKCPESICGQPEKAEVASLAQPATSTAHSETGHSQISINPPPEIVPVEADDSQAVKLNWFERPYNSCLSSTLLEEKYIAYANNLVADGQGLNGPYRTVVDVCGEGNEEHGGVGYKNSMAEVFQNKPVTMMLRNYPRERTQECLLSELKASVLHDSFDFLYLPTCVQTKTNKGYAFVNFKSTAQAEKFYSLWHKTWFPTRMRRPMTVAAAAVQGLIANVRRICDECNVKRITNAKFHPVIYDEAGNRVNIHDLLFERKLTPASTGKPTSENRRKKVRGAAREPLSTNINTSKTM
eukprot:GEMP01029315.1.p1 GENE.GEMP01029315.1~~GEMP01029315.1.p1  ORF type:complete len:528 (-),score=98.31 GEMP01029315.1:558-2141(-)